MNKYQSNVFCCFRSRGSSLDCFKYNSGCPTHWQQWSQGTKCKSYQNTAAAAADATLLCIALAVKNVHLTGPHESEQKQSINPSLKKYCCCLLIELLQHTLFIKLVILMITFSSKCQNISIKRKGRSSFYSCNKTQFRYCMCLVCLQDTASLQVAIKLG